jgi:uncharacterized protein (TIGR00297 family)
MASSFDPLHWQMAIALNLVLLGIALLLPKKLLTPVGYLHAWVLGVIVWATLGWPGYVTVLFYFLFGSAVTRLGLARKQAARIAEQRDGQRGPANVWGSAAGGVICALLSLVLPAGLALWQLGYVGSLAAKLSDTTASEVGKAYGKRTFSPVSFKPVPAGTEGAVSLEGSLAGIVASGAIALLGWGVGLISLLGVAICVLAALVATSLESILGSTLQGKVRWLSNEVVNGLMTMIGAAIAITAGLSVPIIR